MKSLLIVVFLFSNSGCASISTDSKKPFLGWVVSHYKGCPEKVGIHKKRLGWSKCF